MPSLISFATAALYVQAYCICEFSILHACGAARTGVGMSSADGLLKDDGPCWDSIEVLRVDFGCDSGAIMHWAFTLAK